MSNPNSATSWVCELKTATHSETQPDLLTEDKYKVAAMKRNAVWKHPANSTPHEKEAVSN